MTLAEDELRHDPWLMHLLDHDPERAPYRRLGAFFIVGAGGEWRAQISRFGGSAAAEMASWSTYSDVLPLRFAGNSRR
jgi:hypothetical protein